MLVTSAGLAALLTSVARAQDPTSFWKPTATTSRPYVETSTSTPTVNADNQIIKFDYNKDTTWDGNSIFTGFYQLDWAKDETIKVKSATLWKTDSKGASQGSIWGPTGPEDSTSKRSDIANPVDISSDLDDDIAGSISLNATKIGGESNLNTPLFLQVYWENSTTQGVSYSRYFAMTSTSGGTTGETTEFLSQSKSTGPAMGECTGYNCPTPSSDTGSSSLSTSPVSTSSSSSSAGASASQAAASSSSSGLSTGAIAGIAVACGIVGLALISAAIWFLCCFNRRQRRNGTGHSALAQHHQQNGSYVSDGMARGMRSDKELPHVTDSPQSAFAPNRGLRDSMSSTAMGMGVGAGAGAGAAAGLMTPVGSGNDQQQQQQQQQQQPMNVHHQHQHSSVVMSDDGDESTYTPYRDHTPPPTNLYAHHDASTSSQTSLPSSLPPHGGARSPTPPISSRYAHLVEEGMTDEEIRRLEEEERALDVAIEDAGRSSRAQSYTQGRASGGGGR